jgi:ankyrin repeat protein
VADSTDANSHLGDEALKAIQTGAVSSLRELLQKHPELVNERIDGQRTLLHVATDWPGRFPNNAATVATLVEYGAAVNSSFIGRHSETLLHWAASNNDVAVLDVLLDNGADIEARGGVIGGGSPLADAVAFGQWEAARRLVERGAIATLWQAAALGLQRRVEDFFATEPPSAAEVTNAFWCACHGGQRMTAEYLLGRGADVNWAGYDGLSPLDAAIRSGANSVAEWLRSVGGRSASGTK